MIAARASRRRAGRPPSRDREALDRGGRRRQRGRASSLPVFASSASTRHARRRRRSRRRPLAVGRESARRRPRPCRSSRTDLVGLAGRGVDADEWFSEPDGNLDRDRHRAVGADVRQRHRLVVGVDRLGLAGGGRRRRVDGRLRFDILRPLKNTVLGRPSGIDQTVAVELRAGRQLDEVLAIEADGTATSSRRRRFAHEHEVLAAGRREHARSRARSTSRGETGACRASAAR